MIKVKSLAFSSVLPSSTIFLYLPYFFIIFEIFVSLIEDLVIGKVEFISEKIIIGFARCFL